MKPPQNPWCGKAAFWGRQCAEQLHAVRPKATPDAVHAHMWRAGAGLFRYLRWKGAVSPEADEAMNIMLQAYAGRWAELKAQP